jgi:nonribosomal peptide synthetase protein VioG
MTIDPVWKAWRQYNNTSVLYPDEGGLVAWITRAANEFPDRMAVQALDAVLTYAELSARSNAVAAFLRDSGAAGGEIVAVAASRNIASYVGLLGALKAGCGYVPVDPADPSERLRFVLADAKAVALLGTAQELVLLGEMAAGLRVCGAVDRLAHARPVEPAPPDPDRASYVIYTSGTSGMPKGVRIAERSVVNFVHWVVSQHEISARHRLAQAAPLTFDPSIQQIFPAWVTGACVLPVPDAELFDPAALARWLRTQAITHLDIVTSHWQQLREAIAQDPALGDLPDLRWIIIGGETLHYQQVRHWHQAVTSPALLDNIYGPTEATVNATWTVLDPAVTTGQVPIGVPLPNYRLYVVDDAARLCPPGVVGELLIAGDGVAQRYQSAEATACSFGWLALPDGTVERIYRTGDLACLLEDGREGWTLEFRGRADTQVKIRGYRIELEELEAVAKTCPGVHDAAVLVRAAPTEQLVCFFTADDDVTPAVVRRFQADRLAAHQVPNLHLRIASFPLTRNGKLDRVALLAGLPEAAAARPIEGRAPKEGLEKIVADVWSAELGLGGIGAEEDFFTVGGTSVSAVKVTTRLRALGIKAEPGDLFDHPTVAELAEQVGQR